jgi:glycosyltransferase involved in cell wall biosynthesis
VFWSEGHAEAVRHASGVIPWLRRNALRLHHAFAVPNCRSADWIRSQVRDARILTLPNTVDGAFFTRRSLDERGRARMALGFASAEIVVLQVSQLTQRKGVIALSQAFLALSGSAARSARLVFVGAGTLEQELRRIAAASAGRVIVAGQASVEGVRTWLMAADWFALNSSFDPNPLSPIEASFTALPLLLTRHAGNFGELLLPGKTGFEIADPADPSSALMQALTTPPDRTAEMGVASFENARTNFDISIVANDLIDQLIAL